MSLRLWLVRHGESTWNAAGRLQGRANPPLTELGREQARRVGRRLAALPVQALYCSPQQRALETARIIGRHLGVEPRLDERLQEYDIGEATGTDWEGLLERWPHLGEMARQGRRISRHIPGAEEIGAFHARVLGMMDEIQERHEAGDVAVVAHGGVFSDYLATLLHVNPGFHPGLRFDNGSLTLVESLEEGRADVIFVNETCHLSVDGDDEGR
ncbi:MAG: histidine phosphatase family protein [Anaerolineales bacterium]